MAQVGTHRHLVSIVGVVTRGRPKILVLAYCEHGELKGALHARVTDGRPFGQRTKTRFCSEIAQGMAHLASRNYIHRDLAARNVLLATGMICKVADFGLSRHLLEADNGDSDYYRSSGGMIPVRWTSPEGLAAAKFSVASDVWSFAIVVVEIMQDGMQPYSDIPSNPAVINFVNGGGVHPQPTGCDADTYTVLAQCWQLAAEARPTFCLLGEYFACKLDDSTIFSEGATFGCQDNGTRAHGDSDPGVPLEAVGGRRLGPGHSSSQRANYGIPNSLLGANYGASLLHDTNSDDTYVSA